MSIELDPNTHKFFAKVSQTLDKNAKLMMAPISHLSIDEQVRIPNYAIAVAIQDVANVIRQELDE